MQVAGPLHEHLLGDVVDLGLERPGLGDVTERQHVTRFGIGGVGVRCGRVEIGEVERADADEHLARLGAGRDGLFHRLRVAE